MCRSKSPLFKRNPLFPEKPQAGIHYVGIIEDAPVDGDFLQGLFQADGRMVGPMGGHGLYRVGHCYDPGLQKDIFDLLPKNRSSFYVRIRA